MSNIASKGHPSRRATSLRRSGERVTLRSTVVGSPSKPRTGTVYLAVLGVALIVGVIGIASLHVARLEIHELETLDDMARARLAARSGVECLLAKIKSDLLWRTTYASGVTAVLSDLANTLAGGDSFRFTLTDTDGNLGDNVEDSVTIRCVGESGDARHVVEVLLQPSGEGLTSLSASLHVAGNMNVEGNLTTDQTVSSNGNIDASKGSINGNAQAMGSMSGSVSGTSAPLITPLEMPDPVLDGAFAYYLANGTPITHAQLSGAGDKIDKTLLSAGYNPFGSQQTNPQGIYVLDCHGHKITIKDSRIHATLVFIDADEIKIEGSIHWEPALPNFPAMMVQGKLTMKWSGNQSLTDITAGRNLNPASTPYLEISDNDIDSDPYLPLISGLIYATGDLNVEDTALTSGVIVVGGAFKNTSAMSLSYDSIFFRNAPPGFAAGTNMQLAPGTWKQVSY